MNTLGICIIYTISFIVAYSLMRFRLNKYVSKPSFTEMFLVITPVANSITSLFLLSDYIQDKSEKSDIPKKFFKIK